MAKMSLKSNFHEFKESATKSLQNISICALASWVGETVCTKKKKFIIDVFVISTLFLPKFSVFFQEEKKNHNFMKIVPICHS